MITKPVSKIFNVYNGTPVLTAYDSTKKDREGILEHLAAGQIAFIDTKTNEAVDPSSATFTNPVDIFYRGNDEPVYIHKHPGSKSIMKSDLHNVNLQLVEDGAPFVALIRDYKYCCDGEYGFRFVIHNAELDKLFWPNGYYETYMVDNNECCTACGSTATEDDNIITLTIYKKIMAMRESKDSVLKPSIVKISVDGSNNETISVLYTPSSDYNSLTLETLEANLSDGDKTALWIEVDDATAWPYAQFNFKYTHIRSSRFEVGKIANSVCSGKAIDNNTNPIKSYIETIASISEGKTFTSADGANYSVGQTLFIGDVVTKVSSISTDDITVADTLAAGSSVKVYTGAAVFEMPQTYGYDLKAVEYALMGYRENMSPYRLSDVTMTEFGYNYSFNDSDKYIVLTINYEKESDTATVHMPYPMSLVLTFASSKASDAENVVKFLTGETVTESANINLK